VLELELACIVAHDADICPRRPLTLPPNMTTARARSVVQVLLTHDTSSTAVTTQVASRRVRVGGRLGARF
jgi:hypothetical protein